MEFCSAAAGGSKMPAERDGWVGVIRMVTRFEMTEAKSGLGADRRRWILGTLKATVDLGSSQGLHLHLQLHLRTFPIQGDPAPAHTSPPLTLLSSSFFSFSSSQILSTEYPGPCGKSIFCASCPSMRSPFNLHKPDSSH